MHSAALNGDLDLIRSLHDDQHVSVNTSSNEGSTPLHLAAQKGHDSTIRILHELGSVVNPVDNNGSTPLHKAAYNGHDSTIRLLHELGGSVSTVNNIGSSPLCDASQYGHVSTILVLHELGADLSGSLEGISPLQIAAEKGHVACVQYFISNGVPLNSSFVRSVIPTYSAPVQAVLTEAINGEQPFFGSNDPTACFSLMKLISSTHIG